MLGGRQDGVGGGHLLGAGVEEGHEYFGEVAAFGDSPLTEDRPTRRHFGLALRLAIGLRVRLSSGGDGSEHRPRLRWWDLRARQGATAKSCWVPSIPLRV